MSNAFSDLSSQVLVRQPTDLTTTEEDIWISGGTKSDSACQPYNLSFRRVFFVFHCGAPPQSSYAANQHMFQVLGCPGEHVNQL